MFPLVYVMLPWVCNVSMSVCKVSMSRYSPFSSFRHRGDFPPIFKRDIGKYHWDRVKTRLSIFFLLHLTYNLSSLHTLAVIEVFVVFLFLFVLSLIGSSCVHPVPFYYYDFLPCLLSLDKKIQFSSPLLSLVLYLKANFLKIRSS